MGLGNAKLDRHRDLLALVHFDKGAKELSKLISKYNWDWDGEPIILTFSDVRRVLARYKNGEIDQSELEWWADAIECREDITYQPKSEETIRSGIFALANPSIHCGEYGVIVDNIDRKFALAEV